MKLLFDENLSRRLVARLADAYPGSTHVSDVQLDSASDSAVWEHALKHGLAIVSKDDDFRQRAQMHGPPPKVIIVALGNCTTNEIEDTILAHTAAIERFSNDDDASVMVLNRIGTMQL